MPRDRAIILQASFQGESPNPRPVPKGCDPRSCQAAAAARSNNRIFLVTCRKSFCHSRLPFTFLSFLRRCNKTKGFIFPIVRQMTHLVICSSARLLLASTADLDAVARQFWAKNTRISIISATLGCCFVHFILYLQLPISGSAFVSGPASGVAFRGSTRRWVGLLTHAVRLSFLWVGSCGLSLLSRAEMVRLRLPQMSRKVGSGRRAAGSKTINLGLMPHKDISIFARIFSAFVCPVATAKTLVKISI